MRRRRNMLASNLHDKSMVRLEPANFGWSDCFIWIYSRKMILDFTLTPNKKIFVRKYCMFFTMK